MFENRLRIIQILGASYLARKISFEFDEFFLQISNSANLSSSVKKSFYPIRVFEFSRLKLQPFLIHRESNFFFLVLGVPGFAAAMIRHLHSLRRLQRDHGWIHTLLEEAENERMHLMTFMALRNPGPIFRYSVILTQYLFTASFSLAYLINPNFCHRYLI